MPLIRLQKISRSYGRVQALKSVSLTLEPGTIGLVGNNGAGKSTLLKILLGLLRPDHGSGEILGHDIRRRSSEIRGRVGYMAEAAAVIPTLRGVEFVTLSGDLYGMPHRQAKRRAHEVLNYVGLGELRYRRLEEYSTGNLQRLKLAAALVHDPDLLLLDEPTNGLDPRGRQAMLKLIQDLIRETGKSVVLCTHLLGDVERLCKQVVVLHQGTVLLSGSMADLRRRASNHFELGWQADAPQRFERALLDQGVQFLNRRRSDSTAHAVVHLPGQGSTTRLFQLANECGAVITLLRPQEEDLQQLFFRVTQSGEHASTSQESINTPQAGAAIAQAASEPPDRLNIQSPMPPEAEGSPADAPLPTRKPRP